MDAPPNLNNEKFKGVFIDWPFGRVSSFMRDPNGQFASRSGYLDVVICG